MPVYMLYAICDVYVSDQNKAVEFSKMQICVDLFLFSSQYTDVATLVNLPKFTAGQLFYYPVSKKEKSNYNSATYS